MYAVKTSDETATDDEGDEPDDVSLLESLEPGESQRLAAYWKGQIETCDDANSRWHKRGDTIMRRFRDERSRGDEDGQRRLNLLWAGYQIMRPAIYGRVPTAICDRRFVDKDPVGRLSAQILERSLRTELEDNNFDGSMRRAVADYLLPGRGIAWVRYEPEIGESVSIPVRGSDDMRDAEGDLEPDDDREDEATEKLEETGEQLLSESAPVDYLNWKDFYVIPANARTWDEVTAVAKKVPASEDECVERFGEEIGKAIRPDPSQQSVAERMSETTFTTNRQDRKRIIIEIWNKSDRRVYWMSTGYDRLCDLREDPLGLTKFFPVPEPLSATMTNDTMIPVPDYMEWQDQALQVDELTARINMLSKACKVAGTYDAAQRALRRMLDESVENELIPVEGWAAFKEKGGVEGSISWLPIKQVVETMQTLIEVRDKVLNDIDRLTGITDVLRSTNDARETLGGQRLRNNNAGTRLEDRRQEVARFARDVVKLVAEVIAKHFTPKKLIESSGILYSPEFEEMTDEHSSGMPGPMPGPVPTPAQIPGPVAGLAPGAPQPGPVAAPMGGPPGAPPVNGYPMPAMAPQQPAQVFGPDGLPMSPLAFKIMDRLKKAIELLRNDIKRGYRIDIETDTMIIGDVQQEREDAIAFVKGVGEFLQKAAEITQVAPNSAPLLGKMLQFAVRKYRTGRDLESTIDDFVDQLSKTQKTAANKPNPEADKAAAAKAQSEAEIAKAQIETQAQQRNDERQALIDKQETELKMAERSQEHAMTMERMNREAEIATAEHAMRMAELGARRQPAAGATVQ